MIYLITYINNLALGVKIMPPQMLSMATTYLSLPGWHRKEVYCMERWRFVR